MASTAQTLRDAAHLIHFRGLHTGDQFADEVTRFASLEAPLDVCAAIYAAATRTVPAEFFTDEDASLRLIECSADAMQAIRALSAALDSQPCVTQVAPGVEVPDYIEHVSNWAATASPVEPKRPPTVGEVIGRILRAANAVAEVAGTRPGFTDAYGFCITCRGHGSLMVDGEEIPYEELSPRRRQGYDLGHRFSRNTSKPCPHCDGQDRATDAAVSAHEASL